MSNCEHIKNLASGSVPTAAACATEANKYTGVNAYNYKSGAGCALRKCTEPAISNLMETVNNGWAVYYKECTMDGMLPPPPPHPHPPPPHHHHHPPPPPQGKRCNILAG